MGDGRRAQTAPSGLRRSGKTQSKNKAYAHTTHTPFCTRAMHMRHIPYARSKHTQMYGDRTHASHSSMCMPKTHLAYAITLVVTSFLKYLHLMTSSLPLFLIRNVLLSFFSSLYTIASLFSMMEMQVRLHFKHRSAFLRQQCAVWVADATPTSTGGASSSSSGSGSLLGPGSRYGRGVSQLARLVAELNGLLDAL